MYRKIISTICIAAGLSGPLSADETYNIQNVARLDILPGYATTQGHMVAARIKLKPGWKTYWRSPGGNGIPPTFDWRGSSNIGALTYHWPEPSVYVEEGVQTIGYKTELVLPIGITPKIAGEPMSIKGEVSFGICEEVCLPVKARFQLNVAGSDTNSKSVIRAALKQQPQSANSAGVSGLHCDITPIEDGFRIEASLRTKKPVTDRTISVFEIPGADLWVEQDRLFASGNTIKASANLYTYGDAPLILDRSKITLNLLGGNRAIEMRGCPS